MDQSSDKRKNKKRKKNFLTNAKKYGKKGRYGRGTDVDAETYNYFVNVLEIVRKGFDNNEEQDIFVNNVIEQITSDNIVNVSCNQIGCRVIEILLPCASLDVLERYFEKLGEELRPLLHDRFASHILQCLMKIACSIWINRNACDIKREDVKDECVKSEDDIKPDNLSKFRAFALKVSGFLLNNLEDYVWDTYGNHVIRQCLENLSGIFEESSNSNQNNSNLNKLKPKIKFETVEIGQVPAEFTDVANDYINRIILWPQFKDLPGNALTSALVQTMLKCSKALNKHVFKKLAKKLLDECFDSIGAANEQLECDNSEENSRLRVLEEVLTLAGDKMYRKYYDKLFCGKLGTLACGKSSNHTVQKLLNGCADKELFEQIYDELEPHVAGILSKGYTGVLISLAKTCSRLKTRQNNFTKILFNTLGLGDPKKDNDDDTQSDHIILSVFCFVAKTEQEPSFDSYKQRSTNSFQLHGSVMLQTLLRFNKPIGLVNTILSMSGENLLAILLDMRGSHILDAFFDSEFIGEKSRERFVRKLKGSYGQLAGSKYGSRCFDSIWKSCGYQHKCQIVQELSQKSNSWINTSYGKIIGDRIAFGLFARNKDEWQDAIKQGDKKRNLIDGILKE